MKKCIACKSADAMTEKRFCDKCSMGLTLNQKLRAMKQGKYGNTASEQALGALAPELTRVLIALLYRPCDETKERARLMLQQVDQTQYFSYAASKDDAVSWR